MAADRSFWAEWVRGRSNWEISQLVLCDSFATSLSLKEMENVMVTCCIPMMKTSYQVYDRDGNTVREGETVFSEDGLNQYAIKEVLPLDELKPYETEDGQYAVRTQVTLASGHVVNKYFPTNLSAFYSKITPTISYNNFVPNSSPFVRPVKLLI